MDELDRLIYETARQKTEALPLRELYARITAQEGAPAAPPPRMRRRPRARALAAAAAIVAALTLCAVPALAQTVVVDGKTYVAIAGRVSIGGVVYDLNATPTGASGGIVRDARSGEYRIIPQATSAPEQTQTPRPTLAPTPSPTPLPSPTQKQVKSTEPLMVYAAAPLTAYEGPGEEYPAAGELATNDVAQRTGLTDDGWARLLWEGRVVYARMDGLHYAATTGVSYPDIRMAAVEQADVYTLPSSGADSEICGQLAEGDVVIANRTYGEWTRIHWEDGRAYVKSACLKAAPEGEERERLGYFTIDGIRYPLGYPETGETWSAVQAKAVEVYSHTDVTLYAGPGTGYRAVGDLYPGRKATQVGVSGDWAILLWDGRLCYAQAELLAAAPLINVRYPEIEMIVMTDAAVWAIPREEGESLGMLEPGQSVTATGSIGKWAQIRYNGAKAYVLQAALVNPWEFTPGDVAPEVPEEAIPEVAGPEPETAPGPAQAAG